MSARLGQSIVLGLDWNGTVVDDDERARRAAVAVLDRLGLHAPSLEGVTGFRAAFFLPLERYFSSLGVPCSAVGWAVSEWNRQVREGAKPALTDGAEALLEHAEDAGIAVHVISGADYEAVMGDADVLVPGAALASVQGAVHPKRGAIGKLGGPAQATVYVGDTAYDIEEALAAGATAVGLAHDRAGVERLGAAGADLIVESLGEVVPFLQELAVNIEGHTHA